MVNGILRGTVALMPVLVFLGALVWFDSFKVVRPRAILVAALAGMAAAFAGYWINGFLLYELEIDYVDYARWVSPWLEEALKAALIVYLIRTRRVGMIVDAAIYGFAVGTGFALFENLYYLMMRPDTHPAVQVIRGFGTAIMSGAPTDGCACSVPVSSARRCCMPSTTCCFSSPCSRRSGSCCCCHR
jgi:RsiW-degrading membrane proteinase PrsW (M82 family)